MARRHAVDDDVEKTADAGAEQRNHEREKPREGGSDFSVGGHGSGFQAGEVDGFLRWLRRCFGRLAGDWIAQGRVIAHAFQSQATDGLDLILRLDFEMTESERVLEPGQIKINVQSDPELIHRDPGTV